MNAAAFEPSPFEARALPSHLRVTELVSRYFAHKQKRRVEDAAFSVERSGRKKSYQRPPQVLQPE